MKKIFSVAAECIVIVGVAGATVLSLRYFVAEPFAVSGNSMEPTYVHGDTLIVERITYKLQEPKRGDLAVFQYPEDTEKMFVKRIIGLPNETIALSPEGVSVTKPNGETITLQEPYAHGAIGSPFKMILGPDDFFVLGDNRNQSSDSREWGPLERPYLVGKVAFRF